MIDTSKMKLVNDYGDRRRYLDRVVEDDYKVTEHTIWEGLDDDGNISFQCRGKSVSSKWMCIGGPFNHTRKTVSDAGEDYREYNQARRDSNELRVILIHKDLFPTI